MTEPPKSITVSFSVTPLHNDAIEAVAVALSQARGRAMSRSAALRHIINVYVRLDPDMRRAAIAANHEA